MPSEEVQLPNKALLSLIILLGTCFIAVALKRFRRSKFFGRTVRFHLSVRSRSSEGPEDIRFYLDDFLLVTADVE